MNIEDVLVRVLQPRKQLHTRPKGTHKLKKANNCSGRDALIAELSQKLRTECRVLSLVGVSGIGKSSFAFRLSSEPTITEFFTRCNYVNFDTANPCFLMLAQAVLGYQTIRTINFQSQPVILLDAVLAALQSDEEPCLLILDGIEALLEPDTNDGYQFREPIFAQFFERLLAAEMMPARIVLVSQDKPPEVASYKERTHLQYLQGLNEREALTLFAKWNVKPKNIVERWYLQRIICSYEGHPLALRVIAGEINDLPYQGNIKAYWQVYGHGIEKIERVFLYRQNKSNLRKINLMDLVRLRIEISFDQMLRTSSLAALLLCMGTAFECAMERSNWLFLIADYPPQVQTSALHTLERRFLSEELNCAKDTRYCLPKLIRQVAIDRMYEIIAAEIF